MPLTRLIVVAALLSVPAGALAQATSGSDVPRTPWGDPDLQGIWTNQTPVPVERPDALGDKAVFSEEEVAEFEQTALERLDNVIRASPEGEIQGDLLSDIWVDTSQGKVSSNRRTSLVVDPPDGKVPYTPVGRERWTTQNIFRRPFDGPEVRPPFERCMIIQGLFLPNPFENNNHHILQTPDHVAIFSENLHEMRIIPLDGRPHVRSPVQLWLGDSRGHWEAETLVVETTNFNNRHRFRGATDQMILVERFSRRDPNTITYELTVTDPMTFLRPWTLQHDLRKTDARMFEHACHEGNYSMTSILAGARAQEADAEQ